MVIFGLYVADIVIMPGADIPGQNSYQDNNIRHVS